MTGPREVVARVGRSRPERAARPWVLVALAAICACSPPAEELRPVTSALFDPSLDGGFASFPWPNDARLTAAGTPDLTAFPVHAPGDLVDVYRLAVQEEVVGFGTNPQILTRFDDELDPFALPTQIETMNASSPILLIDVDTDSPERGSLTPVKVQWQSTAGIYIAARTLVAITSTGFPLRPGTTYAFVVRDSLLDAEGRPLVASEEIIRLMEGGGNPALATVYAPLGPALDQLGVPRTEVASATVFTTGQPTAELRRIRDHVVDPEWLAAPALTDLILTSEDVTGYALYVGAYETPVFQRGEPPYGSEGGGFEFDGDEPVVQRWESVNFSLSVPLTDVPEDGFPVVIALPGTAGTIYDHLQEDAVKTMGDLLSEESRRVATFSFEPPLHGSRGEEALPDLHTFNYFNPESSRCVLRQEAIDASVAIRLLRESVVVQHPELGLDAGRIGFFGHSQGGHVGALLAAVEPEIDPVYINGMGGGLAYTIVERKAPFDIEELVRQAIGETTHLSVFHPVVGLAQMLAEVVDPINYGAEWFRFASPGESTSVLLSAGFIDPYTPYVTVNGLAVTAGLPPIEPVEWGIPEMDWAGIGPVDLPLYGNVEAADGEAVTAGLITRGNLGHFVVQDCYYTAVTAADFLATGLEDGLPTAR